MFPPYDPVTKARLETMVNEAASHADKVEDELWKTSIRIANEGSAFFEKVAFGCGATVAAVVSFLGTHAGRLTPPYLLRASLVTLVLSILAAMYRNWRYPNYVLVNYQSQQYEASLKRERCRRDLFTAVPSVSMQDGQPINAATFAQYVEKLEGSFTESIANFKRIEGRIDKEVKWVGNLSLMFAVAGICQLIALAWINF